MSPFAFGLLIGTGLGIVIAIVFYVACDQAAQYLHRRRHG